MKWRGSAYDVHSLEEIKLDFGGESRKRGDSITKRNTIKNSGMGSRV